MLSNNQDSDAFKTMEQICVENGFTTEKHTVTTSDGYILNVWRIPGKLSDQTATPGAPILMVHASGCDMYQWVYNTPDKAPAFTLSNAGYDVWMLNGRGTRWSREHSDPNISEFDYWQYEWETMGTKDETAVIDYILNNTGAKQLSLVGHS